ncbi:MAG: protein-S-isoprenylcysteine O-methyltransferase [Pseudomonadota bacterium]
MKKVATALFYLVGLALAVVVISRWQINGIGSLIWLVMAFGISAIRAPFAKRSAQNEIQEKRSTSMEAALLVLVAIGGTFLPMLHLAFGLLEFADYRLPLWVLIIAVALLLPGLWLFWRSHADLGANWSATTELREDQTLITEGVYRRIRHPMYAAIWLIFLPQPLLVQNWIAGLAGPISFAILYFVRVPYEEAMMRDCFGAQYDDYCQRTGRVIPG